MLSNIRAAAKSPFALIIIGLLIASFALWGVNDIFTGGGNAVAVIGDERITTADLADEFEANIRNRQAEEPGFSQQAAIEEGLGDQSLNRLLVQGLMRAHATELGVAASQRWVANEIVGFNAFVDPLSGGFDRDAYRRFLSDSRITEERFERRIRHDLIWRQLASAAFAGAAPPPVYLDTRHQYLGERREVRSIVIPPSAAGDIGDPDDDALSRVIEENAETFTQPERRAFTIARFRTEDFGRDVEVDEALLRETYDFEVESRAIGTTARRSFVQLRASDAETAEAAAERLRAGEDARAIAAALGLDAPLRQTDRQDYEVPDPALADAVFEMSEGEAAAVEGGLGWFAVRVEAATEAEIPSFEDRMPDLRRRATQDAAQNALFDTIALFSAAHSGGATLEESAEAAGAFYEIFPPVDRTGRDATGMPAGSLLAADDPVGMYFPELTAQPEVLAAVFEQPVGYLTDLIPYGDGDYLAVRVDRVVPATLRTLDEAREDAEFVWRLQETDARLQAHVDTARDRLRAGDDIQAVAADIPGARVETATLTRGQTSGVFGQEAAGLAFSLPVGEPAPSRAADRRSHIVVIVDEILPPETEVLTEDQLENLRENLAREMANDLDEALITALQRRYPYTVDPRLRDFALGISEETPF